MSGNLLVVCVDDELSIAVNKVVLLHAVIPVQYVLREAVLWMHKIVEYHNCLVIVFGGTHPQVVKHFHVECICPFGLEVSKESTMTSYRHARFVYFMSVLVRILVKQTYVIIVRIFCEFIDVVNSYVKC